MLLILFTFLGPFWVCHSEYLFTFHQSDRVVSAILRARTNTPQTSNLPYLFDCKPHLT